MSYKGALIFPDVQLLLHEKQFCCLSAHRFLHVSQGQMPGGRRDPYLPTQLEGLLPPWRPCFRVRGHRSQGLEVQSLAGPRPMDAPTSRWSVLFPRRDCSWMAPRGPCWDGRHSQGSHGPHYHHTHLANWRVPSSPILSSLCLSYLHF